MPIRVTCPACQKALAAPDRAAGRTTKCPACGNPVTVPAAPAPVAPAATATTQRAASAAAEPPPRRWNYVGIGATVTGATALLVAFVPLVGLLIALPLAGLALLLAAIGLALATLRRAGWVSPVAGLALSLASILVATVVHHRIGTAVAKSLDEAEPVASVVPKPGSEPAPDGTFEGQDRNGDGRLNADELPDALRAQFATIDGDGDGYVSRAEWDRAQDSGPGAEPKRGKTIATAVFTAADDFLVDAWHNGKKVPDDRREMVGENYGATSEKLNIEVKEGDWLVFNVANNRLRWGGAAYFGVAGVDEDGRTTFQSDPTDGRWSYCDDPREVTAFIQRPSYRADRAALPPTNPWGGGDGEIKARAPDWSGKPVWGRERTTWIKYVAPAPGTWRSLARAEAAPASQPAEVKAEPAKPAAPMPSPVRLVARARLTGHPALVQCLAITADGKTAVSGSSPDYDTDTNTMNSDTVLVWDLRGEPKRRSVIRVGQGVASLALTPDSQAVVVPERNQLSAYSLNSGHKLASLAGPENAMSWAPAVSPEGKNVAGGFVKADVVLWEVATRKKPRTLSPGSAGASRVAFSPDGKQLAAGTFDGVVLTWEAATGRALAKIGTPDPSGTAPVTALAYTADGDSVAAVVSGKPPTLWNATTGERRVVIGENVPLGHHGLAFSADGKRAATTAVDPLGGKPVEVVALWDVKTGALLAKAADDDGPTRGVVFTPDGKTLVSTGGNTVKVWEVAEGH